MKKSEQVTQTVEVNEKEDVEEKVQEKEETRESDVDTRVTLTQGIRKQVIEKIGLRVRPILDKYQDDVFRLPLNKRLVLIGPPGTGKTTTLIKRLGQKIDTYDGQSLSDSEGAIVKRLEEDTGLDHSENC